MGLTRGLSILPSDVVDASAAEECQEETFLTTAAATIEHHRTDTETTFLSTDSAIIAGEITAPAAAAAAAPSKEVEEEVPLVVPVGAYILLASAVVALSSIGTLLNLQGGVNSTLKIAWRKSATIVCILPLAIQALYRDGFPHLTTGQWRMLILVAACYAAMCVLFAWSLDYTTVGNAVMISNSQALILLIGKVLMGDHVSLLEGGGALVALTGALFCSGDSADTAEASTNTLLGDLYAVLSALSGVGYLVFAKHVRPAMELSVFTVFVMTLGLIETIFFLYLAAVPFSWDFNATQGIFGWMIFQIDRLPVELMMAPVCNLLGAIGNVRAMQYFSSLVISVAALMEPVVAEIMAVLIGVGILPGWKGWFGNGLVVVGTLAVVYQPPGTKKAPDAHI